MYIEDLIVLGGGGLIIIAVLFLIIAQPRIRIVREDRRLVMFKRGRFSRVAGPGVVFYLRGHETIETEYDIKEQPYGIQVQAYVTNIPITYKLELWFCLDPELAANGDKYELRQSVLHTPEERLRHIEKRVQDMFNRFLMQDILEVKSASTSSLMMRLLPYVPGHPNMLRVLDKMQSALSAELKRYGAVLNRQEPIAIVGFIPAPIVVEIMNRGLVWNELRHQLPLDMSIDDWATAVRLMDGGLTINHQKFLMNEPFADSPVKQLPLEAQVIANQVQQSNRSNSHGAVSAGHRYYPDMEPEIEIA